MDYTIKLDFERTHFEELYFSENEGSYFLSSPLKGKFVATVLSTLLLTVVSIWLILTAENELSSFDIGFITSLSILFCGVAVSYFIALSKFMKWKREINNYINRISQYTTIEYIVTDKTLTFCADAEKNISPWESFSNVAITDKYIQFTGATVYIIPIKCMKAEDFTFLDEYLTKRFG
jgi:heme/copper-type cytochrome/quinol oxidase subunit 4